MHNAYYEVARTYWRRIVSSWISAGMAGLAAIMLLVCVASPNRRIDQSLLLPLTWGIGLAGVMLWSHFRDQATSELRQLRPGFVLPHVAILVAVMAIIVLGFPAMMMLRGAPISFGVMAYTAIWLALMGWWILTLWGTLFVVAFAGSMWMFTENGVRTIGPLLRGQHEAAALVLLGCSVYAIVMAVHRMLQLTEEDPLYHRRADFSGINLRPRMTGDLNRAWAQVEQTALFGLPKSVTIFAPTGSSLWRRAARWRRLTQINAWSMLWMAVIMAASMRIGTMGRAANPVMLMFLVWMPVGMGTMAWMNLWRFLEADSLRPIARREFIREIGLAILLDVLRGWICMAVVIAADARLFRAEPVPIAQVVTWLWLSLLLQVPALGIAFWQMRYRSPMRLMLWMMCLLAWPGGLILAATMEGLPLVDHLIVINSIMLLIAIGGLFIIREAYRRWLVTELG